MTGNIVVKLTDKKTMINNLTITFESNGITHTLSVPTRDENLPYNLATAFTEIIKQSDANSEMVIDNLKDEFFSHCEDRTNLCCFTEKQIKLIRDEKDD